MRTTLAIDDDVLAAAQDLASRQGKSLGEVISTLARQALQPHITGQAMRNGVPLLRAGSGTVPVTLDIVNALRDEFPG